MFLINDSHTVSSIVIDRNFWFTGRQNNDMSSNNVDGGTKLNRRILSIFDNKSNPTTKARNTFVSTIFLGTASNSASETHDQTASWQVLSFGSVKSRWQSITQAYANFLWHHITQQHKCSIRTTSYNCRSANHTCELTSDLFLKVN